MRPAAYQYSDEIFNRLSVYFGLKHELANLKSVKDHFVTGLEKLTMKFQRYEELMGEDLDQHVTFTQEEKSKDEDKVVSVSLPVSDKVKPETALSAPAPRPEESSSFKKAEAKDNSQYEINIGQKWLLIIGIVTMVFGIGYFLKYSFEQGWVGPAGRVTMAYIWGIIFLIGGDQFRKRKFSAFGLSLVGGGIATLYFSTFAAFNLYHLFSQTPSFLVMVVITVLASVLAIVYDTKWLAILGLIGGFLTPVMLSTGHDNYIFLMTYMTILNLGLLSVAFYKKWDILNILGFVATYLIYTGWFSSHYNQSKFWPAILFITLYYFIYSIIPFAYQFLREKSDGIKGFLIITPNSFLAFGFSYFMIRERFSLEWVSVITILYAVVFLLMASYLYKKEMYKQNAFVVLLGKAALFLIITIPVIFSKHWITIFWAAQATVLLWTGIRLGRKSIIIGSYILLGGAVCKFLFYDYSVVFKISFHSLHIMGHYTYIIVERYITSLFVLLVIYEFACFVKKDRLAHLSTSLSLSPKIHDAFIFMGLFCLMLFIILNVETYKFFDEYLPNARFAAISVLWTLFSVVLMVKGFSNNNSFARIVSLGLFLITLTKVFLFDMSKIHTPYRILSFIILGIVLIGTSYLYHRNKNIIIRTISADKKEVKH